MNFKYNFPKNKRAAAATITQQIEKLKEELDEVIEANEDMDEGAILEETMDLIFACEGVLRKWPKRQIDAVYEEVVDKAFSRRDVL